MIYNALLSPAISNSSSLQQQVLTDLGKTTPAEATETFASFLKAAIDGVAAQEQQARTVTDLFLIGEADVNDVLIAASKAELSLNLTAQVRNKVVEAYQEIMRMQI